MNYNSEKCPLTLNTTRICANNSIDTAIEISKIGFANMRPNAVILVNEDEVFDGIVATALVHFPINAAILFTHGNKLSKETLKEIQRLSPRGYKGIDVILVGNISKNISSDLNEYGFITYNITGHDHYETACIIPKVRKGFKNVLIISGENYSEGIIAGYWSAHHGDPILYVKENRIPKCTLESIKKMKDINVYIIGSIKTISKDVENELYKLDNVKSLERIDGYTPYDIAVNFAKYKDQKTEFGWGRNYREGHAFTFGELDKPMEIIAGSLFAHMGKHTPHLIVGKNSIPTAVEKYIESVKPIPPKDMPRPPFMHGFILGTTKSINHEAQIMIEDMLSIDHGMMEMKHDMMGDMNHEKMKHEMMDDMNHEKIKMKHDMMDDMNHGMMEMKHEIMDDMKHEKVKMKHEIMHDMNHKKMEMKHEIMENMDHEDNQMSDYEMIDLVQEDMEHLDNIYMMHHMTSMDHYSDKQKPMYCMKCNNKMNEEPKPERLFFNYEIVNIKEILD